MFDANIQFNNGPTDIIGQGQNQVPQNACATATWWSGPSIFVGDREYALGDIVRNEQQYQTLQEEFTQFDEQYLYEMLTHEPEILESNDPDEDVIYQNWMDSISMTNIAAFYAVLEALDSGNITDAILINAQINPENTIEANRKLVNFYYLTKFVQGTMLGYEDSLVLAPIALQTPYVGGDAVFGARVMLGMDPDEEGIAYKRELDEGQYISEKYRVYPNPAHEVLTIEMVQEQFTADSEVRITDVIGNTLLVLKPGEIGKTLKLPVGNLANGVYVLQVNENDCILFTERIVINN